MPVEDVRVRGGVEVTSLSFGRKAAVGQVTSATGRAGDRRGVGGGGVEQVDQVELL